MSFELEYEKLQRNAYKTQIDDMVAAQIEAQAEVDDLTLQLKEATDRLNMIQNVHLPELLDEIQQTKWTTKDGVKVVLRKSLKASIFEETSREAIQWLKTNGYSAVIKNKLEVEFGKGNSEEAAKAYQLIQDLHPEKSNLKEYVHPMTLSSLCKEIFEKDMELPSEYFSIYHHKQTKITPTKE